LQLLEDAQADKENEILREIKQNVAKHIKWNDGYIDMTRAPLTPTSERSFDADFRPAITTEYLPTPPASESSEHMRDALADTGSPDIREKFAMTVRQTTPDEDTGRNMPSFRRRIGRGGRMLIDRRNLSFRNRMDVDPVKLERFKYDQDNDDTDLVYERDEYDIQIMQHRAYLSAKSRDQAAAQAQFLAQAQAQNLRRLSVEGAVAVTGRSGVGSSTPSNGAPRLPQSVS
jgi:enhancer of polycomb-like protein